jgi:transposase
MLKMDQVAVVRHRVLVEGASRREVAESLGISRNTVKRYLAGAPVGVRQPSTRKRPALEQAEARMEALLAEAPRWTGGKQRLTARQLHRMLRAEGIQVGETLVKQYVRERKRRAAEVFVPLVYRPGDLGENDFFEVLVDVAGKRGKACMFVLRPMFSGRDFAWLFPRQDQTCFLEGHVRAFDHLGGVLQRLALDYVARHIIEVLWRSGLRGRHLGNYSSMRSAISDGHITRGSGRMASLRTSRSQEVVHARALLRSTEDARPDSLLVDLGRHRAVCRFAPQAGLRTSKRVPSSAFAAALR